MIKLENVELRFNPRDKTPLFSNINLEIQAQVSHVILGQSGMGKTTLLKLISGLITPTFGKITLGSTNVGMLFQKNALFDSLTVFENLEFPLREKKKNLTSLERTGRVLEFLQHVGLSGTEKLFPENLSGGMQKRLGIARALIVEPEIILYDEPTAGLDPLTSKKIIELILRLKNEMKSTLVAVTSDVPRAFELGDTLSLLTKNSRLLNLGTPEQAKQSRNEMVVQFITGSTKGPLTESLTDADQVY